MVSAGEPLALATTTVRTVGHPGSCRLAKSSSTHSTDTSVSSPPCEDSTERRGLTALDQRSAYATSLSRRLRDSARTSDTPAAVFSAQTRSRRFRRRPNNDDRSPHHACPTSCRRRGASTRERVYQSASALHLDAARVIEQPRYADRFGSEVFRPRRRQSLGTRQVSPSRTG